MVHNPLSAMLNHSYQLLSAQNFHAMQADPRLLAPIEYEARCCSVCGTLIVFDDGPEYWSETLIPFRNEPMWQQLYAYVTSHHFWQEAFDDEDNNENQKIAFLLRVAAYQQYYLNDLGRGTGAFLETPKPALGKFETPEDVVCHCGCRLSGGGNVNVEVFYALSEELWDQVYYSRDSPLSVESLFGQIELPVPLVAAFTALRCKVCYKVYIFDAGGVFSGCYRPNDHHRYLGKLFPEVKPTNTERANPNMVQEIKALIAQRHRQISTINPV